MMKATADFDFDAALLEFGLPGEMMTNINRGPQHTCGLDYRIIPLDSPGIKKMKNSKQYQDEETDDFYVGKIVKGYSGTDNKIHQGRIVNFVWNPDDLDEIQSIVILDDETMKEVEVLPNSAVLYVPPDDKETIVCDDEGFQMMDKEDLERFEDSDVNESLAVSATDNNDFMGFVEDEVYRDTFVREYGYFFPDKCFKYFDKKFAGEYQSSDIQLTGISLPWLFRKLMGADDMDKFELSMLVKKFVKIYVGMTSQDENFRINIVCNKDDITFNFNIPSKAPVVSSWFHLWCYTQAYKKCNMLAQRTDDFEASESWVYKPNSRNFRTMIGNSINYDLIHLPEKKVLPDGTVKTIMKIED